MIYGLTCASIQIINEYSGKTTRPENIERAHQLCPRPLRFFSTTFWRFLHRINGRYIPTRVGFISISLWSLKHSPNFLTNNKEILGNFARTGLSDGFYNYGFLPWI